MTSKVQLCPLGHATLPAACFLGCHQIQLLYLGNTFLSFSDFFFFPRLYLFLFQFNFIPDTLTGEVDQGGPTYLAWVGCYHFWTHLPAGLPPP